MYKLHYAPDNASMIIRLVLESANLPYELHLVDRKARQQDSESYRKLNPTGLIPTLETPFGPIAETGAILLWLADRHNLAPDPKAPERQYLLHWLFYLANTLHADLRALFYPHRFVPSEAIAGHHAITVNRLLGHFAVLDQAATAHPSLFNERGILAPYCAALMRWSVLYPVGQSQWFTLTTFTALNVMARSLEACDHVRHVAVDEGLGTHPFTAPDYAKPSVGSAT